MPQLMGRPPSRHQIRNQPAHPIRRHKRSHHIPPLIQTRKNVGVRHTRRNPHRTLLQLRRQPLINRHHPLLPALAMHNQRPTRTIPNHIIPLNLGDLSPTQTHLTRKPNHQKLPRPRRFQQFLPQPLRCRPRSTFRLSHMRQPLRRITLTNTHLHAVDVELVQAGSHPATMLQTPALSRPQRHHMLSHHLIGVPQMQQPRHTANMAAPGMDRSRRHAGSGQPHHPTIYSVLPRCRKPV